MHLCPKGMPRSVHLSSASEVSLSCPNDRVREAFSGLWKSAIAADKKGVQHYCKMLGVDGQWCHSPL